MATKSGSAGPPARGARTASASRPVPAGPWSRSRYALAALLAVGLLLAGWFFLREPEQAVRNLDTPGRDIVCLGDSLTAGVGAAPGEDFPSLLAAALARPVVNAGVSGDTTADALGRVKPDVLTRRPGIVVVCLGGNDFMRRIPLEAAADNLRRIVREVQGAGAMVVIGGFAFPSLNEDWAVMYAQVAAQEQCLLVPHLLEGIERDPALKSDSIHPNARGYAIMAGRLEQPLRALMRRAGWTD